MNKRGRKQSSPLSLVGVVGMKGNKSFVMLTIRCSLTTLMGRRKTGPLLSAEGVQLSIYSVKNCFFGLVLV
jgi:hypothetical protein